MTNRYAIDPHPLVSFDFTNESTWDVENFNISSINSIPGANLGDFIIPTYGQTAVDNGEATAWSDKLNITSTQERKMLLKRSAGLFQSVNPITEVHYLEKKVLGSGLFIKNAMSGGFLKTIGMGLTNFFKIHDKPYQLLPYRYANGFSAETAIVMTPADFLSMPNWEDGIFFYMGTRSEDKFSLPLRPELELIARDDPQITLPTKTGIESNGIALKVGQDGTLSFRYIDSHGIVQNISSSPNAIKIGWSVILLTFLPLEPIADDFFRPIDDNILSCAPARVGKLALYVNGHLVLEKCDHEEFFFKPLTEPSPAKESSPSYKKITPLAAPTKQAGVTYTLSWGSGVAGLKNALQYNHKNNKLEPQERFNNLTIQKNFSGIFQGAIQYLRIWDTALSFLDARNNFNSKARGYGLPPIQTGRTI